MLTVADASISEDAGTVDLAVTLSGTSASAIGFTWATAPNPDPWITGYRVERREYSPKPPPTPWVRGWTLLGDDWEVVRREDDGDTSTFFIDGTDADDKLYVYRVWPYSKWGTSRYSPTAFQWARLWLRQMVVLPIRIHTYVYTSV